MCNYSVIYTDMYNLYYTHVEAAKYILYVYSMCVQIRCKNMFKAQYSKKITIK